MYEQAITGKIEAVLPQWFVRKMGIQPSMKSYGATSPCVVKEMIEYRIHRGTCCANLDDLADASRS